VRNADSRFVLLHVLATRRRGTKSVYLNVRGANDDFAVFADFGPHFDKRERGMTAVGRVKG
jgi:hypothetical protein